MDMKAFYSLSYGLYVVSSLHGDKDAACVVNTLQQVTSAPAKLSVTVNKDNFTAKAIAQSGVFAATVMAQEIPLETIGTFGFKSSVDTDKFSGLATKRDENGVAYLVDGMTARFSCKVLQATDVGTHITFVGEIIAAEVLENQPVLTYAYYQTVKKGGTPKNAPSFKGEGEPVAKVGYRCSVCGYVLESDVIPANFKCPICGQGAEKLVKL